MQKRDKQKIVVYDIETSPTLGYMWGKWQQDMISEERSWYILSFAYKWLGQKKVYVRKLPDYVLYKSDRENDKALVQDLWELFDKADIIIAHNGDKFDQRKSNARFLVHGFDPPAPYKSIDTLKIARKYFKFNSNRLDDLAKYLGLGRKVTHTGFKLWKDCMMGDMKAWRLMAKYNKQDVVLLEGVYYKLRPWMDGHPNVAKPTELHNCPKCGSYKLQVRGFAATKVNKYRRYKCQNCGGWSQSRLPEKVDKPEVVN